MILVGCRCLGEMTRVHSAFYGQPQIQLLLQQFLKESCERLSICHLAGQLEHFWSRVFDEKTLSELLACGYPVLGFMKAILIPLLEGMSLKIAKDLIEIDGIRRQLGHVSSGQNEDEFQRRMSVYSLRNYALTNCASNILTIVSNLLHVKGTTVIKTEETPDHVKEESRCIEKSEVESSIDLKVMEFKQQVFGDELILTSLLTTCIQLLLYPNIEIIYEAFRIPRVYVKQSTKNFSPIHSITPKFLLAIYQSCIKSLFESPLFDPMSLIDSNQNIVKDSISCTQLKDFISGKDPSHCLSTQIATTLYESLRGLFR